MNLLGPCLAAALLASFAAGATPAVPAAPAAGGAAVGFGLTAYLVGVERGWIPRDAASARTLATLETLWRAPQGPARDGVGAPGWFDDPYLGIDEGPILLMLENYRSGFVWDLLKRSPYAVAGLRRAGFRGGWLEEPQYASVGPAPNPVARPAIPR